MKWSAELELKPTEDFVTVKSDQPIVPQMGGGRRSGRAWGWGGGPCLFVVRSNYSNTPYPR